MRRITVSLPEDLAGCVEREASRGRTSVSEVIRRALVASLKLDTDQRLPFESLGASGQTHIAEHMEDLLAQDWAADINRHRDR
jgi:Arc/MetJ-type ribon-helix-helix transcriptional regulator